MAKFRGRTDQEILDWQAKVIEIDEARTKKGNHNAKGHIPNLRKNGRPDHTPLCKANKRDGTPCRAPALRGAPTCQHHDGYFYVPDHPASRRLVRNGVPMKKIAKRHTLRELMKIPREARKEARAAIDAAHKAQLKGTSMEGQRTNAPAGVWLQGAQAYIQYQNGNQSAWFRWKKNIPPPSFSPWTWNKYNTKGDKKDSIDGYEQV